MTDDERRDLEGMPARVEGEEEVSGFGADATGELLADLGRVGFVGLSGPYSPGALPGGARWLAVGAGFAGARPEGHGATPHAALAALRDRRGEGGGT